MHWEICQLLYFALGAATIRGVLKLHKAPPSEKYKLAGILEHPNIALELGIR